MVAIHATNAERHMDSSSAPTLPKYQAEQHVGAGAGGGEPHVPVAAQNAAPTPAAAPAPSRGASGAAQTTARQTNRQRAKAAEPSLEVHEDVDLERMGRRQRRGATVTEIIDPAVLSTPKESTGDFI